MACNIGTTERIIRVLIGIALLAWAIFGLSGTAQWVVGIVGLVPLVTGVVRFCPLWSLLGINTCKAKHAPPTS